MQTTETIVLEINDRGESNPPLEKLLAATLKPGACPPSPTTMRESAGVVVGSLEGFSADGLPLVNFPGSPGLEPWPARHACPLSAAAIGRAVVLIFENGDVRKPIVVGLLEPPVPGLGSGEPAPVSVSLDGEQIALSAKNEIVLRCGRASITLTRAGKVLIRGAYVHSRSSGVNRIKGGSVQIN